MYENYEHGKGYTIVWQRDVPDLDGVTDGASILDVLTACKNRLQYFENNRYDGNNNEVALSYLERAIDLIEERL